MCQQIFIAPMVVRLLGLHWPTPYRHPSVGILFPKMRMKKQLVTAKRETDGERERGHISKKHMLPGDK